MAGSSAREVDAKTVLSRSIAELGIYPAVDPLESTSRALEPAIVGEEHYRVATGIQELLQNYKDLFEDLAGSGVEVWVSTPSFADLCLVHGRFDASLLPELRMCLLEHRERPRHDHAAARGGHTDAQKAALVSRYVAELLSHGTVLRLEPAGIREELVAGVGKRQRDPTIHQA